MTADETDRLIQAVEALDGAQWRAWRGEPDEASPLATEAVARSRVGSGPSGDAAAHRLVSPRRRPH